MKKIFILIFVLISIVFYGCSINDLQDTPNETIPETVIVTETVIEYVEVENTDKIEELELQLADRNKELQQYNNLINNLNELLGNVYYGYASNSNWILDGFTAFSLEYNDKFYLITAGHAVEDIDGKYSNHKFKANFSNEWFYPKLLTYDNNYDGGKDYAVFYSDKINKGFEVDLDNDEPKYKINNSGKIESYTKNKIGGESGSPVIDLQGEVTEILTTGMSIYNTNIDIVLKAIDNLK